MALKEPKPEHLTRRPQRCANCRFFSSLDVSVDGLCRRYPPTEFVDTSNRHPFVTADEWCGEWQKR